MSNVKIFNGAPLDSILTDGQLRVGMRDRMFGRAMVAATVGDSGLKVEWDSSGAALPVMVFTDLDLEQVDDYPDSITIAWMIESPQVTRRQYRWLAKNAARFDAIFTFSQALLTATPNAVLCPLGGCWIEPGEWAVASKASTVSLIASEKKSLPGQRLRHRIVRSFRSRIDSVVGRGYQPVESKQEALAGFRYSIVVENCRTNWYFSEKLVDCFACGTVPIYWGCPDIARFFNPQGIIPFRNRWQLRKILSTIGEADYSRRLEAVKDNFTRAAEYATIEACFSRALLCGQVDGSGRKWT